MWEVEALKHHCLSLKATTCDYPFGEHLLCFRVGGKIYAICDLKDAEVNLKAEPNTAVRLRDEWPDAVRPGYHMNKKHWNTVDLRAGLPAETMARMVEESYRLVFASLPKKVRESI
jgi:predicted DNA-binding protein (MmcQ/YjbR family)